MNYKNINLDNVQCWTYIQKITIYMLVSLINDTDLDITSYTKIRAIKLEFQNTWYIANK